VRQAAAKAAQDAGLLDVADDLGIALPTVTSAITDQGSALDTTRAKLKAFIEEHTTRRENNYGIVTETLDAEAQSAQNALKALNGLAGQTTSTAGDSMQLAEATGQAAGGMGVAAGAAQQLMANLQDTADAAGEARQQTDLFKTSLDILTGQNVSLLDVQSQLYDALAAASDAMTKEGGAVLEASGALDLHTVNGRKAADVLLDVRNSGNELIATMIQQGATTADVSKADLICGRVSSRPRTRWASPGATQTSSPTRSSASPASAMTTITADTSQANNALNDLADRLAKMGAVATVQFNTANARDGFAARKALGGPIFGPGTGTSDSIPALLSNGEHVITAREVQAAGGHGVIQAWRKSLVQGFADGGAVSGWTIPVGLAKETLAGLEKRLTPTIPGPGGSVQRWAGLVAQALGLLGQPGSLVGAVLQLIQHESGGNPNAINLTDSNARAGHPSQGLMQTIPGTFAAYAGQFRGLGITNPLANIFAGLNYGIHRYGSVMGIPGIKSLAAGGGYKPYDSGGLLEPGYTLAYNGTGKAETVRTAGQEAALQQPVQVRVFIGERELTDIVRVEAIGVATDVLTMQTSRGSYNG
jgi:hypothetical protein